MAETNRHRKIYVENFGPIPEGHEIHHIDGNHFNNDPSNLIAVSMQEHYDIHYAQGDYAAAYRIAQRIGVSAEEKSRLASLAAIKGNAEGKCGFGLGHASEAGKKGGVKGGAYAKKHRTGIFALSEEKNKQRHFNSVVTKLINNGKACRWPREL